MAGKKYERLKMSYSVGRFCGVKICVKLLPGLSLSITSIKRTDREGRSKFAFRSEVQRANHYTTARAPIDN